MRLRQGNTYGSVQFLHFLHSWPWHFSCQLKVGAHGYLSQHDCENCLCWPRLSPSSLTKQGPDSQKTDGIDEILLVVFPHSNGLVPFSTWIGKVCIFVRLRCIILVTFNSQLFNMDSFRVINLHLKPEPSSTKIFDS